MGLGGLSEGLGRERGRSAIELAARYALAAAPAHPRATGGAMLSPVPQVGARRPNQPQVLEQREQPQTGEFPPPCPDQPPSLAPSPQLPARAAVSYAFARGTGRYDRASRSPRQPRTSTGAAQAPLQHHPQVDGPFRPGLGVAARAVLSGSVCASLPAGALPAPFLRMWTRKRLCT